MTIEVKQNLVSSSKYNVKCPYSMDAEYITYHNTANDASAQSEIKYMLSNNNSVSYHFAIDDKEVIQGVPLNRNAWHCGDGGKGNGNRKSIGVEVCYSKSGGERYVKAEKLANKFIAQLLHERGWGVDRVKPHFIWSGKNCPHRIRGEGRWNEIISEIQAELNALKGTKLATNKPAPTVNKGYLEKGDKGANVKELQTLLEKAGFEVGTVDGVFGDNTDKAVRAFQTKHKISVDGLVGNSTMQVLEAITVSPTPQFESVDIVKKYSPSELEKLVDSSPYGLIDVPFTGGQKGTHVLAMKVAMSKLGFEYHFKQYGVNNDFNQETYDGLRAVQWGLKTKGYDIELTGVFDKKTRKCFIQLLEERRIALAKKQEETKKEDMYRVLIDGKQVGAYIKDDSILKAVEDALKDDEVKIQIEKV